MSLANREVKRQIQIDQTRVDKGGHKHYMAKEIAEQPVVVAEAIRHVSSDRRRSGGIARCSDLDFTKLDRLTMVACGTALLCLPDREILVRTAGQDAG